jgi:hypothetical protein
VLGMQNFHRSYGIANVLEMKRLILHLKFKNDGHDHS